MALLDIVPTRYVWTHTSQEWALGSEYVRCFTRKTIHGSCEDYRAATTIDLEHDEAARRAGRKIGVPALALWGRRSAVGQLYADVLEIWREAASDVTGGAVESGHYPQEEAPQDVLDAFERFFG